MMNSNSDRADAFARAIAIAMNTNADPDNTAPALITERRQRSEAAFRKLVASGDPGSISERDWKVAAQHFDAIGDAEAADFAQQCRTLAEQARQKRIYRCISALIASAISPDELLKTCNPIKQYEDYAQQFLSIPDYQDARQRAAECQQKADELRETFYQEALEKIEEAKTTSDIWGKVDADWKHSSLQWIQQLTVSVGSASEILDDAIVRLQVLADCDYRDAEVLLADAEQRRKEYVRAEESRKRRIKDKAVLADALECMVMLSSDDDDSDRNHGARGNYSLKAGCLGALLYLLVCVIAPLVLFCIVCKIFDLFF